MKGGVADFLREEPVLRQRVQHPGLVGAAGIPGLLLDAPRDLGSSFVPITLPEPGKRQKSSGESAAWWSRRSPSRLRRSRAEGIDDRQDRSPIAAPRLNSIAVAG
jgi:hypothetical protein